MGLFSRIAGFVGSFVQFGGPAGPGLNANSGALEARNAANNAFAVMRGATPVGDNDLTTKVYVDTLSSRFYITAQANAVSALIANTATEHFIIVSTPGTGTASAYVAGTILWDDGSSAGNVTIIGPIVGAEIFTTTSFTGGSFTFNANTQYIWTGSTWQNMAPTVAGVVQCIDFSIGTAGSQSSVTTIPAGAIVLRCEVKITVAYSAGATIAVGQTGTTNLLQTTSDNFPTVVDEYDAPQRTDWGGSALAVLVTIAGSPSAGAGKVTVLYSLAQA